MSQFPSHQRRSTVHITLLACIIALLVLSSLLLVVSCQSKDLPIGRSSTATAAASQIASGGENGSKQNTPVLTRSSNNAGTNNNSGSRTNTNSGNANSSNASTNNNSGSRTNAGSNSGTGSNNNAGSGNNGSNNSGSNNNNGSTGGGSGDTTKSGSEEGDPSDGNGTESGNDTFDPDSFSIENNGTQYVAVFASQSHTFLYVELGNNDENHASHYFSTTVTYKAGSNWIAIPKHTLLKYAPRGSSPGASGGVLMDITNSSHLAPGIYDGTNDPQSGNFDAPGAAQVQYLLGVPPILAKSQSNVILQVLPLPTLSDFKADASGNGGIITGAGFDPEVKLDSGLPEKRSVIVGVNVGGQSLSCSEDKASPCVVQSDGEIKVTTALPQQKTALSIVLKALPGYLPKVVPAEKVDSAYTYISKKIDYEPGNQVPATTPDQITPTSTVDQTKPSPTPDQITPTSTVDQTKPSPTPDQITPTSTVDQTKLSPTPDQTASP